MFQMRVLPKIGKVTGPLFVLLAVGCQASVDGDRPGLTASGGSSGTGSGGGTSSGGAVNQAGSVSLPPGSDAAALLPARIRRLSVAEYQASVSDPRLIGSAADAISADFVPDSRQGGFTVNEAQRVDPVFAKQLSEAAAVLAANVRQHAAERAECPTDADPETCATKFIRSFGEKAYRRPLGDDEVTQLTTVFRTAFDGGSYEEGIELVVRAMLQSAAFLYLTEIGDAPAANVRLTPYEVASSISYLVQGGPPSEALLDRAKSGSLDTVEGRAALLADADVGLFQAPPAAARISRVMREWLGIDKIGFIAKDSNIYKEFEQAKPAMARETDEFLKALIAQDEKGSLQQLLAGDWAMANAQLGPLYAGAPSTNDFQRIASPGRLGILNQGAFLSVFSHAHETAPVLRGVAVMRRVACLPLGEPVNLGMAIVPPLPDPKKSTRQRYAVHGESAGCATCHAQIDSFGFAFEQFDGMGKFREKDNDVQVDASVVVAGTDFAGSYADSNALVKAMSTSPQVRQCFARQVFRALAATSEPALRPSEDDFVKYWDTTLTRQGDQVEDVYIIATIGAFLTNPTFNLRRAQ
jgi:Protein of unknown function (DUF1588)/Protein of unknown function (DUF1592)/Protein of unknown function (DUF1595)/Protein of unknown function (DUF1587)